MQDFTNLLVWQKAHTCTIAIYQVTKHFPSEEKFGLISQIRRASISIESNLAEGCGRNSDREFARFVSIAQGSAFEVRCQLILARDLDYISREIFQSLQQQILEINPMLNALYQKLTANS